MRRAVFGCVVVVAIVLSSFAAHSHAQVTELHGSWIIDGYRFDPGDRSPRGTIAYDRAANTFTGTYVGLKLPAGRPELHAWLYDTRSKQAVHLGKVPYQTNTVGKKKAAFQLALPAEFKEGRFGRYEVVAFSAEAKNAKPAEPSGSKIQPTLKPAFYLYAALPGANIPQVYCGHGQDFSFTSNQDHTCFD
jgi:hypothetical protein